MRIIGMKWLIAIKTKGGPLSTFHKVHFIALNFAFQMLTLTYTHILCADFQKVK